MNVIEIDVEKKQFNIDRDTNNEQYIKDMQNFNYCFNQYQIYIIWITG